MVTMQTAENALKSFYLDAVSDALNTKVNPFLAKIKKTSENVVGKDVRKLVKYGVNGGIGAGSETGDLPKANGNKYVQFVSTLKNLYGTIEISAKAVRAAANNEGAFVNLLNDEMQGLINSSKFNFGRMLYGNGMGKLSGVTDAFGSVLAMENVQNIVEGMIVDFYTSEGEKIEAAAGRTILAVNRNDASVTISGEDVSEQLMGSIMCLQGSYNNEITGLEKIFSGEGELYGVDVESNPWLKPQIVDGVGNISENIIQRAIDTIEEVAGSKVNMIVCSWGVRRALANYCMKNKASLPTMEIEGGYTALSFCGIPVVADRFCPLGTMYLLNTDDFKLHQLCDWQWLEGEDGKVLKQVPGKPVYTATLVKYAELMCERPNGQGVLKGIIEA
ncbi:MAG: phage major capsid protein [Clostridia bacterium]|nr:phage major capsid protein [Clostridia bacterium]